MLRELSLGGVESLLNRIVQLDAEAEALLAPLQGKIFSFRLSQPDLQLYLLVAHNRLDLMSQYQGLADAGIQGEAQQLLAFLRPTTRNQAQVTLSGDLELIQQLQKVLFELNPDWEASLSRILGPHLGWLIAQRLRKDLPRLPSVLQQLNQTLVELLRDEAQLVIGRSQFAYSELQLTELRSQIHQLERRLTKLEAL